LSIDTFQARHTVHVYHAFHHRLAVTMGNTLIDSSDCYTQKEGIGDMNDYGQYICDEGCEITATGGSATKIRIYYGYHYKEFGYTFHYKEKTYSLPATIPCTNDEFDCDPMPRSKKHCRYELIYSSAKAVVGAVDHGDDSFVDSETVGNVFNANQVDGEDVDYEGHLFVDGVPFEPSSTEPPRIAEPLSGGLSAGPLEMTDIAVILVLIVSLINLCCFLRLCARKCFRKSGTVAKYRKVQVMASEVEDKEEEEEEQQML